MPMPALPTPAPPTLVPPPVSTPTLPLTPGPSPVPMPAPTPPPIATIHVLADDHDNGAPSGAYFHFDIGDVPGLASTQDTMSGHLTNTRTGVEGSAVLWPRAAGGSAGNAHGRFEEGPASSHAGKFQVGDILIFTATASPTPAPTPRSP